MEVFWALTEIGVIRVTQSENSVSQMSQMVGFEGLVFESPQHFGGVVGRLSFARRRADQDEQWLVHQSKPLVHRIRAVKVRREAVGRRFVRNVAGDGFGLTSLGSIDQKIPSCRGRRKKQI